jgi:putative ABC transport system permease protein
MAALLQDIRYGWRVLRKSPGFAIVAVLVLALGIGANTAIFSVVNAVLLRPLPFEDSGRLVHVWHVPPPKSFPGITTFTVSPANFLDWRNQNHVFEGMSAYGFGQYTLTGTGHPEALTTCAVTYGFFSILRTQPLLGRVFLPSEDYPGHDHEVVLSYGMWRSRYGANPAIVGQNIELNGEKYNVIGVMGPGFEFPIVTDPKYRRQMWKPLAWTDKERAVRDDHNYGVLARLKPDVALKQAQAEMDTISNRLAQQYPADNKGWGAIAIPLREDVVGDVKPALLILLGAVAFVLLIACANVANLVLAKTLARRKEIAIRTALGATRRRVLQQVLSETVLLAIAGGAVGLIFAHFGIMLIVKFLAQQLPRSTGIGLDGWVLVFTLAVSLLTGFAAGLLPALRLTREDVNQALKQGFGRTASDSAGNRTRSVLVVCEVALSLMLLIGAGLLIRSLWVLRNVNPGFDPNRVITMTVSLPATKFPAPAQLISFFDQVLQRVRPLPGVQSAGLIDSLPLGGSGSHQPIAIEGRPPAPMSEMPEVDVRLISPGYVSAMRIPVVQGRDIDDSDVAGRPGAVLISQSMAKQFWPNENPIGKHLTLYFFPKITRVVVGIVGDVKDDALNQTRSAAALYYPIAQASPPNAGEWQSFGMTLAVRTSMDPVNTVSAITNSVHEVDAEVPLLNIATMGDTVSDSLSPQRFTMLLLAAFAGLALVLAAVGIYSVLSYAVRRRVREIGIRMALGAQLNDVLRMVVVEGMKPTLIGVIIGLAGALALGRVLSSVIYGISVRDWATFGTVSVLLTAVGLAASIIPAYRATRVDPMRTLREE